MLAGRILAAQGSSKVADVRDLLARRPDLARPFLAGAAALLGFPPFVLFFTEVAILLAAWQAGLAVPAAVALGLLLVWPLQILRLARRGGLTRRAAWEQALFTTLARLPEAQGALEFHLGRALKRRATLIEYK